MIKFTTEQRHEIYKHALAYYKFKQSKGINFTVFGCIFDIVYNIHLNKDLYKTEELMNQIEFPEIHDNALGIDKPEDIIKVFEQAIKDSNTELDLSM